MPSALRLLKLAVITVAVFIVALVVLFRLIIMLAGSASSSGAGIGSPWAGQPVDPRFTLTRVFDEYPPVSWAAWKIVNQDSSPLTVKAVILNGEYVAPLASQLGPQFFVAKEQSFPVWLSIGNSGLFFEHGAGISSVNYLKDVIFVDVFTNRGNYRYRCNDGLFVRLTADDEKGDASAVRQYVPMADAKTQERRDSADQQINMLNALRLRGSEPYIPPGMQEPKDLPAGLTGANPRAAGGANSTAPQTQPAPRIQRVAEHWLQRDVPKKQSALERPNQGPQK